MSRADLRYERPSRWSRVAIIVSALAVGFLTVWVLTPIVLANLAAPSAAVGPTREAVSAPRSADELVIPARAAAPVEALPAERPPEPVTATIATPEPAPAAPAVAAVSPSALSISADEPPAAPPANAVPWPVQAAGLAPAVDVEPASGSDVLPSAPPDDFGPVPLPRKRPDPALAARLAGIPLPRPRPDAAPSDATAQDQIITDPLWDRTRPE